MSIVVWLIVGALTGLVFHRLEKPPRSRRLAYLFIGVVAAIVGGIAYHILTGADETLHGRSLVLAGASAILVVSLFEWMQRRRLATG
jgi:uncharacterized membrane protein YeaQ/YmgE (transglycosylase-associated protein family)